MNQNKYMSATNREKLDMDCLRTVQQIKQKFHHFLHQLITCTSDCPQLQTHIGPKDFFFDGNVTIWLNCTEDTNNITFFSTTEKSICLISQTLLKKPNDNFL
ncbi:unnamed protein product [Oppiella nova]|uniref:Uncharacterized protein n=1 Tax=Oppiella nova TaxID=334625 RepID=A0A7R9QXV8_9ACAR|nr:unnamed protein product [Oppiella nova]CAG2178102.1 unnamed protein product [Oppiella nova]